VEELVRLPARRVVEMLRRGEVTPAELIDAAEARVAAVDPVVNALPVRCYDRARDAARRIERPERPGPGWLGGLPVAIKDAMDVAGVRSTQGSPIFADHVPERSDIQVETLERNGGVVIARSNSPEFAAGANTFNEVFGKTLNPWDTRKTCGGSSGGAAVALATGEVWLANGSDLGGSLRIPASFCSVVGLRPSPGVVAHGPGSSPFDNLSVSGPMGRVSMRVTRSRRRRGNSPTRRRRRRGLSSVASAGRPISVSCRSIPRCARSAPPRRAASKRWASRLGSRPRTSPARARPSIRCAPSALPPPAPIFSPATATGSSLR
jgi:hypothetical protein